MVVFGQIITQGKTTVKTYTTTAREPSIYVHIHMLTFQAVEAVCTYVHVIRGCIKYKNKNVWPTSGGLGGYGGAIVGAQTKAGRFELAS